MRPVLVLVLTSAFAWLVHYLGNDRAIAVLPMDCLHSIINLDDQHTPVPEVDLQAHRDSHGGWNIHILTKHFRFAPEEVNGPYQPGAGHAHLYADGEKVARIYGPWIYLSSMGAGPHTLTVTLQANDHRLLALAGIPISATLEVKE